MVLMNLIPKECHGEPEVVEAKQVELKKLEGWNTYKLIKDKGQFRMSTTWVIWKKKDGDWETTRARLVAWGFEERLELPKDSPTIDGQY